MSKSGVYIECSEKLSVGQKVTISYLTSNNTNKIEIPGKIVWIDDSGFAMMYL